MEDLLGLLSLANLILCSAIVGLVWLQRKGISLLVSWVFKKKIEKYEFWTELVMPTFPLLTGGLIMLVPGIPIPEMFVGGLGAKLIFGLGLGMLSGWIFRIVKKMVFDKLGKKEEATPYE